MNIVPEVAVDRWIRGSVGSKAASYAYNKMIPCPRVKVIVKQGKKNVKHVTGEVIHLGIPKGKAKVKMAVRTVKPNGDSEARNYARDQIVGLAVSLPEGVE